MSTHKLSPEVLELRMMLAPEAVHRHGDGEPSGALRSLAKPLQLAHLPLGRQLCKHCCRVRSSSRNEPDCSDDTEPEVYFVKRDSVLDGIAGGNDRRGSGGSCGVDA